MLAAEVTQSCCAACIPWGWVKAIAAVNSQLQQRSQLTSSHFFLQCLSCVKGSEQLLGFLGLSSHQANNLLICAAGRKGVFLKKTHNPKPPDRTRLQVQHLYRFQHGS